MTLDSPDTFYNTVEFFESGLSRIPSPKQPLFGRRPILSKSPLKRADYYEWIDWETVDLRRRYVGSGLRKLFSDGSAGGRELDVVGLYSGNCPGTYTDMWLHTTRQQMSSLDIACDSFADALILCTAR